MMATLMNCSAPYSMYVMMSLVAVGIVCVTFFLLVKTFTSSRNKMREEMAALSKEIEILKAMLNVEKDADPVIVETTSIESDSAPLPQPSSGDKKDNNNNNTIVDDDLFEVVSITSNEIKDMLGSVVENIILDNEPEKDQAPPTPLSRATSFVCEITVDDEQAPFVKAVEQVPFVKAVEQVPFVKAVEIETTPTLVVVDGDLTPPVVEVPPSPPPPPPVLVAESADGEPDVKTLKLEDLRKQAASMGLETKGTKSQLIERILQAKTA
jgi:hypothetical protein